MAVYTPTVTVQFAFGCGPMDTPAWTTPSNAKLTVEAVEIERGRSSEFDDFPAARCQIRFRDGARVLDPSNTAGPYYGQLLPRVPVRVVATVGATPYVRFYGFVDGWPLQNGRGLATVQVTATDATKILSSTAIPTSVYAQTVLADGPVAYWRLGAKTGDVAADSAPDHLDGTYFGILERGANSVVPFTGDGAVKSIANQTGRVILPVTARLDTRPYTVETWMRSDTKKPLEPFGARKYLYVQLSSSTGGDQFTISLGGDSDTDQFISFTFVNSTLNFETSWAVDLTDGDVHHVVVIFRNLAFNHFALCYIDGVLASTRAEANGGIPTIVEDVPYLAGGSSDPEFVGSQDETAIYDYELTTDQIEAHYVAGTNPWDGDSTGDRIDRVLDLIGWPAGLRSIDNGEFSVGPANIEGRNAWDYLRTIAASEQGRLFLSHDGKITFHQRGRYFTETTEKTSQFVFSDDGAGDGVYAGLNFTYDDEWIVNTATATRTGGEPQTAEDTGSKSTYGPSEKSLSGLELQHDRNARQLAEYLVFRYKDPQVRAEEWSFQPEMDADDWNDVFALEIGYRVTLECKPVNVGTQIVLDQHVERVHDSITPGSYRVEFNGSPVDPYLASYFTWGGVGATQGWGTGIWR